MAYLVDKVYVVTASGKILSVWTTKELAVAAVLYHEAREAVSALYFEVEVNKAVDK